MNSLLKPVLSGTLGLLVVTWGSVAYAAEPNESFAESTVLAAGVLSVSDDLTPGGGGLNPDTVLIARDLFGNLLFDTFNDDDETVGDGFGSAFYEVPVNGGGGIAFAVSGTGDNFFEGDHSEEGAYEATVEVSDFFGDVVDVFSLEGDLFAGDVDEYAFSDFNWFNGSYSVIVDNEVGGISDGDVDFFTFTGLSAGASFTAETASVGSIDTRLGWFSDTGLLLEDDDDGGVGFLSRLQGTVPASGKLTFAVTGQEDVDFVGGHLQQDVYDLNLTIEGQFTADFNGDGRVDGLDLTHATQGWQTRYGVDLDGANFLEWQQQFGAGGSNVTAVPEPTSWVLLALALPVLNRRNPKL